MHGKILAGEFPGNRNAHYLVDRGNQPAKQRTAFEQRHYTPQARSVSCGRKPGETTADNKFTLGMVECLASCGTAPMLQLNQDAFHENLTVEKTLKLIDELAARAD